MNRKELIKHVTNLLRENDIKKPVSMPKQVFHISDDDGNSKDFTVKKTDKKVIYTIEDVTAVIDACIHVIEDSLKHGTSVTIHGFGSLGLSYRKPRLTKKIGTDDTVVVDGRYVPKFSSGNDLRVCAKVYEMSLNDKLNDNIIESELFEEEHETNEADGG